ncbi:MULTISPECIES: CGNR zinc finger domain-containing protein [unclassified Micromonospora]|uniref:CGNR zinc finger domain-containing protein n=1 Tax=unclassified Micromonospora TaxID=2617518 RepID=UPI0033B75ECA
MSAQLALALVSTIRHDGNGGVADDLADLAGLTAWLREQAEPLREYVGGFEIPGGVVDERTRLDVVAVRRAARTLFAVAVRPGPPSRADSASLLSPQEAVARLNQAAGALPVRPVLTWAEEDTPSLAWHGEAADTRLAITAGLARAAIEFIAGPTRDLLRACPAPRCVRYFVKDHPRQEWCKPSCGNRARVARHYQRHTPAR